MRWPAAMGVAFAVATSACTSDGTRAADGPVRVAAENLPRAPANPVDDCIRDATGDAEAMPELLRALCQELARSTTPGAALAIAAPDGSVQTVGVGVRCNNAPGSVLPSTPFRIGSITKSLLASATVAAARRGSLSLDAAVADDLPGLAVAYQRVTWRQLLDHTSGLPDTPPQPEHNALSPEALTAALTAKAPRSPPGRDHHYANANFILLGMALARRTGLSSLEQLRAVVAAGADDPQLPIEGSEHDLARIACGHLEGTPLSVGADLQLLAAGATWTFPAGGVVISAPQLARVGRALPDTLRSEQTVAAGTKPWRYALGMQRRTLADGSEHWFHAGATGNFSAELHILPEHGAAVVVLANAGVHLRATAFAALAHVVPEVDLAPPH